MLGAAALCFVIIVTINLPHRRHPQVCSSLQDSLTRYVRYEKPVRLRSCIRVNKSDGVREKRGVPYVLLVNIMQDGF